MDFSLLQSPDVINALKEGFVFTLTVTVLAMLGGIIIGTPLAMMRLSNNVVASNFAKFYVDLFRGIPLIQVIFIFYFYFQKYLNSSLIRIGATVFECHYVCNF